VVVGGLVSFLIVFVDGIHDRSVAESSGDSRQRSTYVGSAAVRGRTDGKDFTVGGYQAPSEGTQTTTDQLEADSTDRIERTNDLDRLALSQHGIELALGHVDLSQFVALHVSHHAPRPPSRTVRSRQVPSTMSTG